MGIDALESWEKSERDVGKVREEMYRKEGLCQVEWIEVVSCEHVVTVFGYSS